MNDNTSLDGFFGAESTPIPDMREIIPETLPTITIPEASLRNRAAKTALLSNDPASAVSNYQAMVSEGRNGEASLTTSMQEGVAKDVSKMDFQAITSILSDPKLSIQQKQAAVEAASKSDFLKDSTVNLLSRNLMAPSKGEDLRAEGARGNLTDTLREMYDAIGKEQALVNQHGASLRDMDTATLLEAVDLNMMVFGTSAAATNLSKGIAKEEGKQLSLWEQFKAGALAGNTVADIRSRLAALPAAERVAFSQKVLKAISAGSGTIFFSDNHYAQKQFAESIFEQGGYSSVDQFLDNITPLLDVIGMGGLRPTAKAATKALKGSGGALKEAEEAARAAVMKSPVTAPKNLNSTERNIRTLEAQKLSTKAPEEIAKLDSQIEGLKRVQAEYKDLGVKTLDDTIARIERNAITAKTNPSSPAAIVQQTNPEKARAMHEAVVKSTGDEVAEALYGTSRTDAIVSDLMPKAGVPSGRIITKPDGMVPEEVIQRSRTYAADQYTPEELTQAVSRIKHDFTASTEIQIIPGMGDIVSREGGGVRIGAVYAHPNGAWDSAQEAVDQVKLALRGRGIRDDEITILRKEGIEHVPVNLDEVKDVPGNYLVRVDSFHEIDPTDIANKSNLDVKWNWADRVAGLVWNDTGSVTKNLFGSSATLHPTISGAATTAVDRSTSLEKFMLQIASGFSDQYKLLDNAEKLALDKYFREANQLGIKADTADLVTRGFSPEAREAVQQWRDYWDGVWFLENLDAVRSLNASGFELLDHKHARLFVKPIQKNSNITKVYDPAVDMVVPITKQEMDDLYNMGGTLSRMRRPETLAGEEVEHVLVRNTPTEYSRKIRDTDRVVNYREGYYAVRYDAPRFIDQVTYNKDGSVASRRAVAVAGDTPTAQQFADAQTKATGVKHIQRADDRAVRTGSDDWWDVNSAQGRLSQRHRGQPLTDSTGINVIGEGSFVVGPVESAIHAARSISSRTVMRPMLEAAKARFVEQYKDVLVQEKGMYRFPSRVADIGAKGESATKQTADARTTWEHINYLENGYINSLDNTFKNAWNAVAETLGNAGMGKTQRVAQELAEMSPSGIAKGSVFMAMIATNPLRQLLIQSHQAVRVASYNPIGVANGGVAKLAGGFIGRKTGTLTGSAEIKAFESFLDNTGLLSAIDRQNLVRGTLAEAADRNHNILSKGVNQLRKAGFDAGEAGSTIVHAAAVYERYKRLGYNMADSDVLNKAHAEVRSLTYDMNFAGDLPYNQTWPSMFLQFLQVPHKAALQMFDRRLDGLTKARMVTGDMLLWGVPAYAISDLMGGDVLPDDKELRQFLLEGAEGMLLNHYFQDMIDGTGFDLSTLAPYDIGGWGKAVLAMYEGGLAALVKNSPMGSLLKQDGRVQDALRSASRFFGTSPDIDPARPEEFLQVLNSIASVSSGWSNGMKAYLALEHKKAMDKSGRTTDEDVKLSEAFMMALGFQDKKVVDAFAIMEAGRKNTKKYEEEITKDIRNVIRFYGSQYENENISRENVRNLTNPMNYAMQKYANDPHALKIIQKEVMMALTSKDQQLLQFIVKSLDMPTATKLRDRFKDAPITEEQRATVMKQIDMIEQANKPKGND